MQINAVNNEEDGNQNVQRLEGDANSQIILPRVLSDLAQHDAVLLEKRETLINSGKYRGNTCELKAYKETLPELNQEQLEYCIGLLLGDTSLQANNNATEFRLKTQQASFNSVHLKAKRLILLPWVMSGLSDPKKRKIGNTYQELQTIVHKAFSPLVDILQNPAVTLKPNACLNKKIPANIGDYLSPIAIGTWYCGDGGRRDYGKNEGKAIQLHTQGFSYECCQELANALTKRYSWKVSVKPDGLNKKGQMTYLIQVEAESFESFCEIVSPYILPHFQKRLPAARKSKPS